MKFSKLPRIYIKSELKTSQDIYVNKDHFHYIFNVLRLRVGEKVRIFNEVDGEFIAHIIESFKHEFHITISEQFRKAGPMQNYITLGLGLIKTANFLDAADMAVQLGANTILPIITQYSQYNSLNIQKLEARMMEAIRQSERLDLPEVMLPVSLKQVTAENFTTIIYASENAPLIKNFLSDEIANCNLSKILLIIGPEGGFSLNDHEILAKLPNSYEISLGENVLRSETAVCASLAQLNLILTAKSK